MTFSELGAHPALERALQAHGFADPTPVQVAVLAPALAGHDLLVSSRTGSGKTVAFGLVLAAELLGAAERFDAATPRAPRALVIAPTRELAVQVQRELAWLLAETGARVTSCVGGMDPRREAKVLADGVHLVVGTPGRLRDHLDRKNLVLSRIGALVLDEGDEMLDMGFREELEAILSAAPVERRTVLFSATLPKPIVELAKQYTRDAKRVTATPVEEGHADIELRAHLVAGREREHAVVNVLRGLDPSSAIVFRAMRETVAHTAASLAERGFGVVAISGDLTQPERTRAISSLRDRRARVLVATDVAARGLDLPNLELVLHADLPRDAQALQHRSGRTGRAGKKGTAVLLATPAERAKLEQMLRAARMKVTWSPLPSAEEIRAKDDERLAAEIDAQDGEAADDERAAAEKLLAGRDPIDVAIALVRRERARLPAPEELPETARVAREVPARAAAAARTPRAPRVAPGPADTVWFRILLGREKHADPRWLLPLLCRRGEVTRDEIGKIVVLPGETRFEVAKDAAAGFARAAKKAATGRSPDAKIEPLREGSPAPRSRATRG